MTSPNHQKTLELPGSLETILRQLKLTDGNVTCLHPLLDLLEIPEKEAEGTVERLINCVALLTAELNEARVQRAADRAMLQAISTQTEENGRKMRRLMAALALPAE